VIIHFFFCQRQGLKNKVKSSCFVVGLPAGREGARCGIVIFFAPVADKLRLMALHVQGHQGKSK
jgi:hypothetical protein